jgi:hypothetical protein
MLSALRGLASLNRPGRIITEPSQFLLRGKHKASGPLPSEFPSFTRWAEKQRRAKIFKKLDSQPKEELLAPGYALQNPFPVKTLVANVVNLNNVSSNAFVRGDWRLARVAAVKHRFHDVRC